MVIRRGGRVPLSQSCQSCHKPFSGGEVCPHCFAPLLVLESQFTVETKVGEVSDKKRGTIPSKKLPDLQTIKFRPSSALYRSVTQAKTGIASALVAVCFVCLGLFWWVSAQRAGAQETGRQAQLAFENQKYMASHNLWEKAFKNYKSTFDREGQIESLLGMSKCLQGSSRLPEAIVVLQRAQKIQESEAVAERILECHRLLGQNHLEQAEIYFQPDLYGKAFLEAKSALSFFEEGEASDAQFAAANRMAARCSMKLKDFEGAEAFLDQAFQLEGKTKNNVSLASELGKAYAESRQKIADSTNKSYIPTGKIDPLAIQAAAGRTASSGMRKRRGSYGGYTLTTHGIPLLRQRQYSRSPQRNAYRPKQRTSVGEASSYPTHKKPSKDREDSEVYSRQQRSFQSYSSSQVRTRLSLGLSGRLVKRPQSGVTSGRPTGAQSYPTAPRRTVRRPSHSSGRSSYSR